MPGTGTITAEHTVWCSRCDRWSQRSWNTKQKMTKDIVEDGWRKKKYLWVCPDCLNN